LHLEVDVTKAPECHRRGHFFLAERKIAGQRVYNPNRFMVIAGSGPAIAPCADG